MAWTIEFIGDQYDDGVRIAHISNTLKWKEYCYEVEFDSEGNYKVIDTVDIWHFSEPNKPEYEEGEECVPLNIKTFKLPKKMINEIKSLAKQFKWCVKGGLSNNC